MIDEVSIWERVFFLAQRGRFSTSPNPRVGAVIVSPSGEILGEGFHERAGGPHAEVVALAAAGGQARGASVYVNLEPCAHTGRTPPCAPAIVEAGIAQVFCSIEDPDPRTAGSGIGALRERGLTVELGGHAARAERLNEAFLFAVRHRRPFVHLRWAASLDGKIATHTGSSRWISSEAARDDSMRLREEHDAILVGAGTVLSDDPLLTRRLGLNGSIVPHRRIVLDGRLRVSPKARVFNSPDGGEVWLVTARASDDPVLEEFRARSVRVLSRPDQRHPGAHRVDLRALLAALHEGEVRSVLVEGGGMTAQSFLAEGLVERVTSYIAPKLIGGREAPTALAGEGVEDVAAAVRIVEWEISTVGEDLKVTGRTGFPRA